ncbi:hypothetical protein [Oceanithermus sp.]
MRRLLVVVLALLLAQLAAAADLVRVEMGPAAPGFDPADLHTYKIARQTREFHAGDGAIVFVTYWRFEPADVGAQTFEMYLIPPRGEVEQAGYTFAVPASWAGKVKPTFWHFKLNPTKARQQAGKWTVYFLFNGQLKGEAAFSLSP